MTEYRTPAGYLGPRGAPERVFYVRSSTYRGVDDYEILSPDDPEMKTLEDARIERRVFREPVRSVGYGALRQYFANEYVDPNYGGLY